MKHHVERAIVIGFALTLFFMASISAATYWITARVETAAVERARTSRIRLDLATLLSQLQDAELAARGYVITGDQNYLDSYSTTVGDIYQIENDLRQLTADETFDQQKLDQLAPLIQARLADLQQTLDLYSSQGFEAASSLVRAGRGESLMDQIRQTIGDLQAAENTEYAQRDAALSGEMQSMQKAMLLVSLAAVAVIAVAGLIIRRGLIERDHAQKRILRLNRLYATLSQINQTIVRARETKTLFEEICRVTVEHGQFRMAWVGLMDETDGLVKPAAFKGETRDYFENLVISYQDESLGRGPVGVAIREGHSVILQDVAADPHTEPWRERLLNSGFRSLAAVPFRQEGRVIGALAVLSAQKNGFVPEDESLLNEIGMDISFSLDSIKSSEAYQTLVEHSIQGFMIMQAGRFVFANQAASAMLGYEREELLALAPEQIAEMIHPDDRAASMERMKARQAGRTASSQYGYRIFRKDGETRWLDQSAVMIEYQGRPAIQLTAIDITERKRAEEEIARSEAKYRALVEQLPLVIYSNSADQPVSTLYVSPQIESMTGYSAQEWLADPKLWETMLHPADREAVAAQVAQMYLTGKPFDMEYRMTSRDGRVFWTRNQNMLIRDAEGRPQYWQGFMMDVTERQQANERIKRQIQRLTALASIDRFIISSFDLHRNLDVLLANLTDQLEADAAAVLVLNAGDQTLEYKAGRGFRTSAIETAQVRLGQGYAGRVAAERRMLQTEIEQQKEDSLLTKYLAGEGFVSYYGVPLIAKGKIAGVLEVFHRAPLKPDTEWLDFLNTLAGQAAIAIDNATLFENLQRTNFELTLAYNETIEGWSRALDLRDKETEGHSRRVTEMSVKLAERLGVREEKLISFRWGALLHDIGKMGVPDHILHKPGPLTAEEWAEMRRHPTMAYEMLAPIRHLKASLDIPYCHHEKWDGSGYPRGLKGEQIPLAARIFAVADVWDSLTNARPYRQAWPKEKAIEYLKSQTGSHFDPHVVQVLLESGTLEETNQE